MITLSAAEIAAATGGELAGGLAADASVTGQVITDSREVAPGDCFVAIAGENIDGHRYVASAADAGAAVILSEQDVAVPHVRVDSTVQALGALAAHVLRALRERGEISVIGVTGSSGKTTTKDLLGAALSAFAPTIWPVASFNNDIGLPLTVLRCDENTRYLVAEMGASAAGELTRLTTIAPLDIAIVLMVGHAHVGGFGSLADVAKAKSELVAAIRPGGTAILNADDARVSAMRPSHADGSALAADHVRYFSARGELADRPGLAAADIREDALGRASFSLDGIEVRLPIVGVHHVNNALAALSAVAALGLDLARAARAIEGATISPHRMALTERADGVTILDDAYNANPESMRAAIDALARLSATRRVALLGTMLEMGGEAEAQHAEVGSHAAAAGLNWVISVAADAIATGAHEAARGELRIDALETNEAALALLEGELRDGDVVLVKGSNGARLWSVADHLAADQKAGA